jgi:type 1 fimbria pilin
MAIQVGGTTVINNSRQLQNIASVDATTVAAFGAAGVGGGATGGGSDEIFFENGQTVTTNYTITNGKNAMSAGPIAINSGVTVTVGSGEVWIVL